LAFVELAFNFLHNAYALAVTFACNALNVFWVDAYPLEFVSHSIPFFYDLPSLVLPWNGRLLWCNLKDFLIGFT
jgi:hypothetical protein